MKERELVFRGGTKAVDLENGEIITLHENYVSKSMLVEGDLLALHNINGQDIIKQKRIVDRISVEGTIEEVDGYIVMNYGGKYYKILQSSIAYHYLEPGDKVNAYIPGKIIDGFCAIVGKKQHIDESELEELRREFL